MQPVDVILHGRVDLWGERGVLWKVNRRTGRRRGCGTNWIGPTWITLLGRYWKVLQMTWYRVGRLAHQQLSLSTLPNVDQKAHPIECNHSVHHRAELLLASHFRVHILDVCNGREMVRNSNWNRQENISPPAYPSCDWDLKVRLASHFQSFESHPKGESGNSSGRSRRPSGLGVYALSA